MLSKEYLSEPELLKIFYIATLPYHTERECMANAQGENYLGRTEQYGYLEGAFISFHFSSIQFMKTLTQKGFCSFENFHLKTF